MKLKRNELKRLSMCQERVAYIRKNQPLVSHVYSTSIYFGSDHEYIGWGYDFRGNDIDDMFLRMINAACNTEFEFED
jgi:hypothetical protein